jgi:hypothetical protein
LAVEGRRLGGCCPRNRLQDAGATCEDNTS